MADPNHGASTIRRLPVYLLLDCSNSMTGAPIAAVNEGLELLCRELMNDPMTRETGWISLIQIGEAATQIPLQPVDMFVPPTLSAAGRCAMGAGLSLLVDAIQTEVIPTTSTSRGDYRPLVFLLTGGNPSDRWREPAEQLHNLRGSRKPTLVALGCGEQVRSDFLATLTTNVYMMRNMTPDAIRQFFQLISGSIVSASQAAGGGNMPSPTNISGVVKYDP